MIKYETGRVYRAGENEIHRYGKVAQEYLKSYLEPNEKGYYSIPVNGGKYWTIGTGKSKHGEFVKTKDGFLSVNSVGYAWAKVGTPKEKIFKNMVNEMLETMIQTNAERFEQE